MKFVKEVKKEVLDIDALKKSINFHKAQANGLRYRNMRLVMSAATKEELINECIKSGVAIIPDNPDDEYFMGCHLDTNNFLNFGEVRFALELLV